MTMKERLQLRKARYFLKNGILLLLLFSSSFAFGQNQNLKSISGNITDPDGNPLVGATIRVKSTTIGTTSDNNGNYAIKVPESNTVLVYSSIGYETQEVYIKERSIINIQMKRQNNSLAEMVVVGYGSQKKANLTGSVATVDMKQIENIPVSDLSSALRYSDKLPGVHVSGGESRPGEAARIVIRNPPEGAKNGGDNGPVYVIDDVVRTQQDFNLLDPSQIESISIVKDATAAIYGARAAQGVIIVTTKRGHIGKPSISYSGSYGSSDATYFPTMMNGYQQATYMNDMLDTRGIASTDPSYYTPDELAYFKKYNYNWLDMAWKPAQTTRHSLSVSGGSDRATYFAGASYYWGDGNLDKIDYKKWNFQASTHINVAEHVKVNLSVSGAVDNRKWFFLKQGGENTEQDVTNLLQTPQFVPPYVRGLPVDLPAGVNRSEGLHFFEAQSLDNYTLSKTMQLNVNGSLEYDAPFLPGLKAKVVFNKNYNNGWGKQYGLYYNMYQFSMLGEHKHIYGGDVIKTVRAKNGDRVRINPDYSDAYQFNVNLSYDRQFGKHHISILALVEQSESYYETVRAMKEGVANVGVDYMRAAFGEMTNDNSASEAGTLSYAGRVNYNYSDKYIAEFDWRYDASTKFGPGYRWGFFPALSAAWIISKENFFSDDSFIDFLKLRASAGRTGRDRTGNWDWMQRYTLQQGGHGAVFGGNSDRTVGMKLEKLPNAKVRWDNIDQFDVGINAVTLNNRLSIDVDGYYNHGYDLLANLQSSAPFTIGSQMPAENYDITNTMGAEVTLSWNGKIGNEISYNIVTGIGYDNSRIIKYDVSPGDIGTWRDLTGTYSRNRGTEAFVYEGMFRSQEEVDNFLKDHPDYTIFGQKPQPGMLYYKDIRGPKQEDGTYAAPDGKITDDDKTWVLPKRGFNKGLSFGLRWRGLQLHVKTSLSIGNEEFISSAARKQSSTRSNKPAFWANHWTLENTNAVYPAPWWHDDYEALSAFWIRDASAFRVNLINLSYSLPDAWTNKLGLNRCNLYMVATNPFFIQKNKDLLAYSLTSYPTLKTFSFGINLNL